MNAQEALKIIKQNLEVAIHDSDGDKPEYEQEQISALTLAMEALEKQIPKKVVIGEKSYCCPNCGGNTAILKGDSYCFNCGQALDWSDEK